MQYFTLAPPVSLEKFVRYFWVLESKTAYTHHSMGSGCPELIFHYTNQFHEIKEKGEREISFHSGLHAASCNSRQFITSSAFGIFGAYLYPYAITELFGIGANTLINQMPNLPTLLGNDGRILEEEMLLAKSNAARYNILSTFLENRLLKSKQQHLPVFDVIRQVIESGGAKKVQEVHTEAYLSLRQFERVFRHYTGMAPKTFTRISRFHRALEQYGSHNSLTQIAYHCGYYDQSHFIHDFKEFSGLHPKTFFTGSAAGNSWRDA
jgi:AraC-like DNA-binding protein